MTSASPSLPRIVLDAFRTKPVWQRALIGTLVVMWAVGTLMFAGSVFVGDRTLSRLAFPLMNGFWMCGFALTMVSSLLGQQWRSPQGHSAEYLHRRVRRWLTAGDATFVDLSGRARERAEDAAAAKYASAPPDPSVIAMPVLTALGAACLGFAGAMAVAEAYVGQSGLGLGHPVAYAAGFLLVLMLVLVGSLVGATRTTIRVTQWAGERAAAVARSRADAERARFAALQSRMNPEFLLNTLNAITSLAGSDPPRAERVVERLSSFLRRSMRRTGQMSTSLGDEIAFIRDYLDVEEARLGFRLRTAWRIDAVTEDLSVPAACLLPLVEAAIAQAVEPREAGAQIEVTSALDQGGDRLVLSVEDWGPGDSGKRTDTPAVAALRKRMSDEHGLNHQFEVEPTPYGRRVVITLPATTFAPAPHDAAGGSR